MNVTSQSFRRSACLVLAGSALGFAHAADAAVYVLDLNGTVANTSYGSFTSGGDNYQTAQLDLGFGSYAPITLMNGDELQVTIALDGPFTLPGTVNGYQFLGINFENSDGSSPVILPSSPEVSTGTITFSGGSGAPVGPQGTNCGNCLSNLYGNPGPASSFTFTGLYGDSTVQSLAAPFTFNDITLTYQVDGGTPTPTVPEPGTWATMLLGLAVAGAGLRASRQPSRIALAA